MPTFEVAIAIIAKAAGAIVGSIVALIFQPPKTWRGFWQRIAVSLPVGFIFSWVPPLMVPFPEGAEGLIASASLMSFCAWWIIGKLKGMIQRYGED